MSEPLGTTPWSPRSVGGSLRADEVWWACWVTGCCSLRSAGLGVLYCEQVPLAGDAFEGMFAAVGEADPEPRPSICTVLVTRTSLARASAATQARRGRPAPIPNGLLGLLRVQPIPDTQAHDSAACAWARWPGRRQGSRDPA